MSDFIDRDAELARLEKEIGKLDAEVARTAGKLNNPAFVDKAPPAVVEKEREKMTAKEQARDTLKAQMARIAEL